jgi:hypothetical protein
VRSQAGAWERGGWGKLLLNKYPIIILVLFFLLGCSDRGTKSPGIMQNESVEKTTDLEEYHPLKEGRKQIAHINKTMTSGTDDIQNNEYRNESIYLPPQDLHGKQVFPMKSTLLGDSNNSFQIVYFVKDREGIYVTGTQTIKDKIPQEAKFDKEINYLLKNPIKVGSEWRYEVESHSKPAAILKMNATITNIKDRISVPAGTFAECLKVSRSGGVILNEKTNIKRECTGWYSPGVGLVKFVDIETITDNNNIKTLRTVYQLESIE